MSTEYARLKRVRGGHRSSATRSLTKVDGELEEDRADVLKLKQLKQSLEEKAAILIEMDKELLEKAPDEDVEEEIQQADIFSEKIQLAILKLTQILETIERAGDGVTDVMTETRAEPPHTSIEPPHSVVTTPTVTTTGVTKVKLPKLALKKFNGDVSKWTSFWDSFESAVHQNKGLSEVDKFNYLTSMIEHSASEAIEGLSLTASNYNEAVAILKKRFGNKQTIVNKHMEILLNLEPVTSNYNLKRLRRLYDQIESHVRALKALGVTSDAYGTLLSSVLMNKLPSEFRLVVSRHVSGDNWELDPLMKLIEQEIEARERAATIAITSPASSNPNPRRSGPPTTAAFVAGSHSVSCCYCKQPHSPSDCKTVTDVEARKRVLRREGRCYSCLGKNHLSRDCRQIIRCKRCNGRHHTSVCQRDQRQTSTSDRTDTERSPSEGQQSSLQLYVDNKTPVLLQTATAPVFGSTTRPTTTQARIILDSGSQRSYVTTRLKDMLSLETIRTEMISIKTFGSSDENRQKCDLVNLRIGARNGGKVKMTALAVPLICEPICGQPISHARETFEHLSRLDLADSSHQAGTQDLEVDILIGSDYYWRFATGRVLRGRSGPTAIHTRLGWVLSGPLPGLDSRETAVNLIASTHVLRVDGDMMPSNLNQSLDTQLKKFWEIESLGIMSNESSVYDKFVSEISFKDHRYVVNLPWKDSHPELPDNFDLSYKRLGNLLSRLRKNPDLLAEYESVIQDQLSRGVVEIVKEPFAKTDKRIHYLPHHAVVRSDRQTTKLRVVYDASARSGDSPSLNHCLYAGPPFGQKIFDILLRFRVHHTALTGDIEKAFLNVSVAEEDRDALRFIWVDDPKKEIPEIIILRFTRVVFGVSSSPFLLNATIATHMGKYSQEDSEFVTKFNRAIYVDDVIFGAEDDDNAFELYSKSKRILTEGGFNLRRFVTNSPDLGARIQKSEIEVLQRNTDDTCQTTVDDRSYSKIALGSESNTSTEEQGVLGICWNVVEDQLYFDVRSITQAMDIPVPTKRDVVRITAKFFDPLGVICPVIIQFKILFQDMCKLKMNWDDPLTGELLTKWNLLSAGLKESNPLTLPRFYLSQVHSSTMTLQLCGFCDASAKAYAAVVYLDIIVDHDHKYQFIAAKTRVSPITCQSIPRLELLSSLLLARLVVSVKEALVFELPLDEILCFTDSKVTLCWIRGTDREWKQFVENRVREIRRLVPVESWRHCPGRINPADLPSRGMSPAELSKCERWLNGPKLNETTEPEFDNLPEECLEEMKPGTSHNLLINDSNTNSIGKIMKCQDFSSLQRLLMVTAYVLKFVKFLKSKQSQNPVTSDIKLEDIDEAHRFWIQEMQTSMLLEKKFESRTQQLDPYCDEEGVWRCRGRLSHADVPASTQHPILLSKKHHLATLIVRDCHNKVGHNGVRDTLTQLRSRYWIVAGRQFIRKILYNCTICRRFNTKPFNAPPPPPLPPCRVREAPPFCFTGVDYAGPLYVDTGEKVWVCLFTCCIVRAIHLELVPDLAAHTFIRCFKRFTARRGFPMKIISDNATTFTSAAKTIGKVLDHPEVKRYFLQVNVNWSFNLEKAPWQGGFFERMVKSMKSCLKKVVGKAKLTYDELLTSVSEVEMIVNSRPLTYVSPDDLDEPLTPAHLLIGRRILTLPGIPDVIDTDFEISPDHSELTRRMKHFNKVLDHFWRRWRHEYLLELRTNHRSQYKQKLGNTISIGQVVLIHDENHPRGLWKLALVEGLIKGSDGQIRGARVRTHSEGNRTSILNRPVQRLYPLEVSSEDTENDRDKEEPIRDSITQPIEGRPTRRSAIQARNRIQEDILNMESDDD